MIFISAILFFSFGPAAEVGAGIPPVYKGYGIAVVLLVFWHFNKAKFMKLRADLQHEQVTMAQAKKIYLRMTNVHMFFAVLAFAAEIMLLDFKYFLTRMPLVGELEAFLNVAGVIFFLVHLAMIWYWAYRAMGDVVFVGNSAFDHIKANIKFNLVIVLPWLAISVIWDVIVILSTPAMLSWLNSPLVHLGVFGFFIVVLAIFIPLFITYLWDCKPLENSDLKESIAAFCRSQGVKFKRFMSWNALNGGLVTAGVLGLVAPFRYLLITPELINLLDKDELMAVVSHEVGHVKKKHLPFYLGFFLVFMVFSYYLFEYANLLNLSLAINAIARGRATYGYEMVSEALPIITFLLLFILYFYFIIGYFMRNFEREADTYCFRAGINPRFMISSFEKLEGHLGREERKSNWHHYTIPQRIAFLKTCIEEPGLMVTHEKKVRRSLRFYGAVAVVVIMALTYLSFTIASTPEGLLENRVAKEPDNPALYQALGDIYYARGKWEKARQAYENSLHLNYNQPELLNNLAWLLLKCPEEKLLDPGRALKLARDAVALDNRSVHILDTLAEAYFRNSMYQEAYYAAKKAFFLAKNNLDYYQGQLEKMAKYYSKFKNAITI